MEANAESIFEAALKLPENERLALASRLLETMPDERLGLSLDDPDLLNELKRRSADVEGAVSWQQLKTEL
jgi:hypothetical protein